MNQGKKYFVTGIDTDSGKTIVSAILTQHLRADYWKPVQAGSSTDSDAIRSMVDEDLVIHPEGRYVAAPMSPHAAAKLEGIRISCKDIVLPSTENTLIIEGAGGVMVPLNDKELIIDLAEQFDTEVILVSRNYLGSINHTLLSIEYLQSRNINIAGIVFNDTPNEESEQYILNYSGLKCLGHIGHLENNKAETIKKLGNKITLS